MNAPAYQLNADDAREGTGGGSSRVNSSGDYVGALTKAKHIVAPKGTLGMEFEFESKSGEQARFTLYTHNASGEPIYGNKQLQALMAVLKLRGIQPQTAVIEEYDFDARQVVKVQAEIYPDVMNKPVGIVFQMEEYISGSGEVKTRPNFFAPFDANTRQLAVEVLDQAPAVKLDKILASLKDKTLPPQNRPPTGSASQSHYQAAREAPAFDDSIPF